MNFLRKITQAYDVFCVRVYVNAMTAVQEAKH